MKRFLKFLCKKTMSGLDFIFYAITSTLAFHYSLWFMVLVIPFALISAILEGLAESLEEKDRESRKL